VPTIGIGFAREKIDAVPIISRPQTLIAAKMPKVAPAVSSVFICPRKRRGPIAAEQG